VNFKLDTSTDPQVGFRPPGQLDSAAALARYNGPFGPRQAAHLARRAGFGGTPAELARLQSLGTENAIDFYLHPGSDDVSFSDYPAVDDAFAKAQGFRTQLWWLDRLLRTRRQLIEKMTLFWHGHFATSLAKVPALQMAQQIDLFRQQGLGNFRTLLSMVSKDPAMLIWLDNRYNVKAHPNENYAREVMELFTLGLGNYSEDDIREAARAFTGWTLDRQLQFVDNPKVHDDGPKTFLGRTGNWSGDDIVGIIVSQPVHQRFITRKLLEFFVYSDPEPELIEQTAQVYALSGFDIAKTVGTILRSNVFFSTRAYRALPKSPIEYAIGLLRFLGVQDVPASLPGTLARMGQTPLAPPSVKGWDGGPSWINTSTLLARFNFANSLVAGPASAKLPDAIVAQAHGYDAGRVVETIVSEAVQDDVTSGVRTTLLSYLNSTQAQPGAVAATMAANPIPFGYENYQEKIRGALSLVFNLPVNQLN
jgi:uncharacterized protein (DUF1800 family)